jgi:hypothetical protein
MMLCYGIWSDLILLYHRFDVLLDENLKMWLLEVNHNPSLAIDCETEVAPGVMEHSISQVDVDVKKCAVKGALMHAMNHLRVESADDNVRDGRRSVF